MVALRAASPATLLNFVDHVRNTISNSGNVVSVTNMAPATPIANNTTVAPAQLRVERNGSPITAPNQPPACDMASTVATISSLPFMMCKRPKMARTTTVQPTVRRTRCSTLRRRTMATPTPTTTTGNAKRPRPSNHPNEVSMASPNGPAICRYIESTSKMPAEIRPTPQNSTSRPRTTSRAADSGAAFFEGRALPLGGVFTAAREPPREPDDPLELRDEELEPLPDMPQKVLVR